MYQGSNIFLYDPKDRTVALQLRDNIPTIRNPNVYCLPGGHVEEGETPEQCAVRELAEETGYAALPADLVPVLSDIWNGDADGLEIHREFYAVAYDGIQEVRLVGEGQWMGFVALDDLPSNLWAGQKEQIVAIARQLGLLPD